MGQKEKILNLFKGNNWVCTSTMYAQYISDPRTLICKLKKDGYVFEWQWCNDHRHTGNSKKWKLIRPESGDFAPITNKAINDKLDLVDSSDSGDILIDLTKK